MIGGKLAMETRSVKVSHRCQVREFKHNAWMLARSGFYKSGDVEVEENIIVRSERLGKVFITDELSWVHWFLLCHCFKLSLPIYGIVSRYLLFGVAGAGHQKWLTLAWKCEPQTLQLDCWTHGCSQMFQLRAPSWPDVNQKHVCSHATTPALIFDFRMSCFRTAAHSDAASPSFQLGARLQSCQADVRQPGMKYEEQSDVVSGFC